MIVKKYILYACGNYQIGMYAYSIDTTYCHSREKW